MESAHFHHHHQQLQEQLVGCSASAIPSSGYVGASSPHACNSSMLLDGNHNTYLNEIFPNSREPWQKNAILVSPFKTSLIQDIGSCDATNRLINLLNIKQQMSDPFPRFSEMIYRPPSNVEEMHLPSVSNIKQVQQYLHDLGEDILLGNFSSGCQMTGFKHSDGELCSNAQNSTRVGGVATHSKFTFSHVFPSTNISNPNLSSIASSSLGLNLQVLDQLTSKNNDWNSSKFSHRNLGLIEESKPYLDHDRMQESSPSDNSNKTSALINGVTRTKRSQSSFSEPVKKSRFVSRPSCPPLKVRKEKVGDKIAALHRLVAPFGKWRSLQTDTASVLTEAIGYIQFLQDQIQTLTVPFVMQSCSKPSRTVQAGSSEEDRKEDPKGDLRSRGLCLVPLSCTSYITGYN